MFQVNFSVAEEITILSSAMALGENVNLFLSIHLKLTSGVLYNFLKISFSVFRITN